MPVITKCCSQQFGAELRDSLICDNEVINAIRAVPTHYAGSVFEVGVGTNWSDTASWSASSGGASGSPVPISTTTVNFDLHSGDCSVDVPSVASVVNMTAYTGTLTLVSTLTVTNSISIGGGGGGGGNLNTNGKALSCATFSLTGTATRSLILGASTVTLSGTGTVWDATITTGLTFSGASSTLAITNTSATGKTVAGGGLTYGNLTITGSSGTVTFTGTNTWATFTSGASALAFTNAQTATAFVLTGCLSLTGNLVQSSGTVTAPSGCTITNSAASGGATFNASAATDGGGNSGWNFASANKPPTGGLSLLGAGI